MGVKLDKVRLLDQDSLLLCPNCDGAYTHINEPHYSTEEYSCPLDTRGPWINVLCWCEDCNAHWDIIIAHHKGFTFLQTLERDHETSDVFIS